MIVHFVDIGGIVDHRCLNFLVIIFQLWLSQNEVTEAVFENT